jgi:ubiquinone/menaquinone biosynthesis C-methylase UbiE
MTFDTFARWYRPVEYLAFGRALERARFRYLPRLAEARSILILGEGDGRALARIQQLAPLAEIDVVEASAGMIALARQRTGDSALVRFHHQNALAADLPENAYDAVITLFFLDCFGETEARLLIGRLAAALRAGGIWLVSDFSIPDYGWQHWHARLWVSAMYLFFRWTTGLEARALPPMAELLQQAGLHRIEQQDRRAGLIRSELWRKPAPPMRE